MTEEQAKTITPTNTPANTITQGPDGTIHWIYEFSFWKNPSILITTWKVLMLSTAFPFLLVFFLTLAEEGFMEALGVAVPIFGMIALGVSVLMGIAYLIVGLIYGGKYIVLFRMDEKGIDHIQLQKQYDKARAMGLLTAAIGLAGGSLTTAGAGLLSASRQSMHTTFSKVRSVKVKERRNILYLNENLNHNQVYIGDEDFAFVRDYILSRCPKNIRIR